MISLVMIVKDEAKFIERCLASVKPLISRWLIVDTGSTDGTQALIKKTMKKIPGELLEREWVDFGTNRTEALELARGTAEWTLELDADMTAEAARGSPVLAGQEPRPLGGCLDGGDRGLGRRCGGSPASSGETGSGSTSGRSTSTWTPPSPSPALCSD